MSENQRERLRKTPFAHLLEMPEGILVSRNLFTYLLENLDIQFRSFKIQNQVVSFTRRDVSLALGLMGSGPSGPLFWKVDCRKINGDPTCELHKLFDGRGKLKCTELQSKLEYVGNDNHIDDFASLIVLYIFSIVLFPCSRK